MTNVLDDVKKHIKNACDFLGYGSDIAENLSQVQRLIELNLTVKMDDGSLKTFKAFRSQHNNACGPYKGGIRFHQNVSLDEVKALSIWMSLKCNIAQLPFGGSKGGIIVNPKELSTGELERLTRTFSTALAPFIGIDTDILAPDVNTNGQIMAWIVDQYSKVKSDNPLGAATGKPINLGGSLGRNAATGFGVFQVAKNLMEKKKLDPKNSTAAIQGFGNVGSFSAKFLADYGVKIIAVAGHMGKEEFAIYKKNGIDVSKLIEFRKTENDLRRFEGVEVISIKDFWSLDTQILVPAALENSIDENTAKTIKAKIIVEGANGPISYEADKILLDKGITVAPDILANSGGVTVSYFEWLQNRSGEYWTEEVVTKREAVQIDKAFNSLWNFMEKNNIASMRQAAYIYSIHNIVETMKTRGII